MNLQGVNKRTASIVRYFKDLEQAEMVRLIEVMARHPSRLTLHLVTSRETLCLVRQPDPLTAWSVRIDQVDAKTFAVAFDAGDGSEPNALVRAASVKGGFRLVQDAIEQSGAWSTKSEKQPKKKPAEQELARKGMLEAVKAVHGDHLARPLCPYCHEGWLNTTDVPLSNDGRKERWLICSICPAWAAVLMR